ncbi:hypothetical protein ACLI4Z_10120 [Natrialbaceae archaeon A-arb3/5]
MAVIPAFRDGVTILRKNPVILLAGLLFAAVSQIGTIGEFVDSWVVLGVGSLVAFLLGPFFLGGLIGMALEALEGSKTTLGQLVRSGKAFYVSLLGATILFGLLLFVVVFVGMFVGMFSLIIGFGVAGAESGAAAILGAGLGLLVFLVLVLVVFAVFMFLQFFSTAIVVDGARAFDSFSRSIALVRANLLSVVGYSLLWIGVMTAAFAPIIGLEVLLVEPGLVDDIGVDQTIAYAVTVSLTVILTGIGYAYLYAVHTSYYTRLGSSDDSSNAPETVSA